MNLQQLPAEVRRFVGDAPLWRDPVGESPCRVYRFDRGGTGFFLKLCPKPYVATTYSALREARVLDWLASASRLKVPELVLAVGAAEGECLITRELPGRPLSALMGSEPAAAEAVLAEALRQLQAVPLRDCPFDSGLDMRLAELGLLIEQGLGADDAELLGYPGLPTNAAPAAVLDHLARTRPAQEDWVFSHGDLCDANIFVDEREQLHFLDLGRGGRADRWLDIAFAVRALRDDLDKGEAAAQRLLQGLGRPDQAERRRYFELLDELF